MLGKKELGTRERLEDSEIHIENRLKCGGMGRRVSLISRLTSLMMALVLVFTMAGSALADGVSRDVEIDFADGKTVHFRVVGHDENGSGESIGVVDETEGEVYPDETEAEDLASSDETEAETETTVKETEEESEEAIPSEFIPTVDYIDWYGDEIGDAYKNLSLPLFDDTLDLVAVSASEGTEAYTPVSDFIVQQESSSKVIMYSFVRATVNGQTIRAIRKVTGESSDEITAKVAEENSDKTESSDLLVEEDLDGDAADEEKTSTENTSSSDQSVTKYYYTVDGENWSELTSGDVLNFVFSNGKKRTYEFEDENVKVTAKLQHAWAVPDGAELIVTQITKGSDGYNYDAYMQALNSIDNQDQEENGEEISRYNENNTLLYDIAFLVNETDADGNSIEGSLYEYEPAKGSVSVNIDFKAGQLKEAIGIQTPSDVEIVHLPLNESVKEEVSTTAEAKDISASDISVEKVEANVNLEGQEKLDFTLDSFSVVAIDYNNNGISKVEAGTSYSRSQLLGQSIYYGITANTVELRGHIDSNFAAKVVDMWKGKRDITLGAYTGGTGQGNPGRMIIGDMINDNVLSINPRASIITTEEMANSGMIKSNGVISYNLANNTMVDSMIDGMLFHAQALGESMLKETTYGIQKNTGGYFDNGTKSLDIRNLPDGTYYFSGEDFFVSKPYNGNLKIEKRAGQRIVFNFTSKKVGVGTFNLNGIDSSKTDTTINGLIDGIVFNMPNATELNVESGVFGVFLAPNATINSFNATSSGWMICDRFTNSGGEWHFIFEEPEDEDIPDHTSVAVNKMFTDNTWHGNSYIFKIEPVTEGAPMPPTEKQTVSATEYGIDVNFGNIDYDYEKDVNTDQTKDYKYKIYEQDTNESGVTKDDTVYYVKISVKYSTTSSGSNATKTASVQSISYAKNQDGPFESLSGKSLPFVNTYGDNPSTTLEAHKLLNGVTPNKQFKFTLKQYVSKGNATSGEAIYGWNNVATVTNSSQDAMFSLNDLKKNTDYYYKIIETYVDSNASDNIAFGTVDSGETDQYYFDKTEYFVKVSVDADGKVTKKYYRINSSEQTRLTRESDHTLALFYTDAVPNYTDEITDPASGLVFHNYTPKTEVTVKKVWDDQNGTNRPASITGKLYCFKKKIEEGEAPKTSYGDALLTEMPTGDDITEETSKEQTFELNDSNNWTKTFEDLDYFFVDGNGDVYQYFYFVVEDSVSGYVVSYEGNNGISSGTITIKNTESDTTNLSVNKVWVGGTDTPDVTVNVYQLKTPTGTVETGEPTLGTGLQSQSQPETQGQTLAPTGETVTITVLNNEGSEVLTSMSVPKNAVANISVTIPSSATGGVYLDLHEINWNNNLNLGNNRKSQTVFGYYQAASSSPLVFSGSMICDQDVVLTTNKACTSATITVGAVSNEDSDKTTSADLSLEPSDKTMENETLPTAVLYATLTLSSPSWSASLNDLPTSGVEGSTIYNYTYYVREAEVDGYSASYSSTATLEALVDGVATTLYAPVDGAVTVTNTKDTTQFTVNKSWVRDAEGSGTSQATVTLNRAKIPQGYKTVTLYYTYTNDGTTTAFSGYPVVYAYPEGGSFTLTSTSGTWGTLAKDDGNIEIFVNGEGGKIDSNWQLPNTSEKNTVIHVNILNYASWMDENGNSRPTYSLAGMNPEPTEQISSVTLPQNGSYTYTWTDLDAQVKENGTSYDYFYYITEAPCSGFETVYGGNTGSSAELTNEELTSVSGEKTWILKDSPADGTTTDATSVLERIKSITVALLADGVKVKETDVTPDADGKWKYSFDNLPRFQADGKTQIVYTVEETKVTENVNNSGTNHNVSNGSFTIGSGENVVEFTVEVKGKDIINTELTSIKVTKKWYNVVNPSYIPISFSLMRRESDEHGEPVGNDQPVKPEDNQYSYTEMIDKGDGYIPFSYDDGVFTIQSDGSGMWPVVTINDLPLGCVAQDGSIHTYKYYVKEDIKGAYTTRYSTAENPTEFEAEGSSGSYQFVTGGQVTIMNKYNTYDLPATGGEGSGKFYWTGLLMLLMAGIGYSLMRRRSDRQIMN